jgi:hypothetical protein
MVDQSAQHGQRVDDAMEHEAENEVRAAPGTSRAREDLLPEDSITVPLAEPVEEEQHREVLERSELARFVRPSTFPADRAELVAAAREEGAPEAVLDQLGRLPRGVPFASTGEIWEALGHEMEHRPAAELVPEGSDPTPSIPARRPEAGADGGLVALAVGVVRGALRLVDGALAVVQRAVSRSG